MGFFLNEREYNKENLGYTDVVKVNKPHALELLFQLHESTCPHVLRPQGNGFVLVRGQKCVWGVRGGTCMHDCLYSSICDCEGLHEYFLLSLSTFIFFQMVSFTKPGAHWLARFNGHWDPKILVFLPSRDRVTDVHCHTCFLCECQRPELGVLMLAQHGLHPLSHLSHAEQFCINEDDL